MARPTPDVRVDPAREEAELREYLGDAYDHRRLVEYERQLEEEFARTEDEALFYRTSEGYLYNLTAFAMSPTKAPYLRVLASLVAPGARVLDYGCGVGSDGLALLAAGYRVAFADFDNPSTRYLRWRLERRGIDADVYDLDAGPPPPGFDLAFAFDVVEHVDDPVALLERMEACADTVLVNFLEPEPGETALHRSLPVDDLVARAARRRLRHYSRHHGRSHLLSWSARAPGRAGRLRSRAVLARGRAAERARRASLARMPGRILARLRRLPVTLGYVRGPRIASRLRRRWVLLRHPHADIRIAPSSYLGPGFSLHMPEGGTFVAGPYTEFRRNFRAEVGPEGKIVIGQSCRFTYDVLMQCSTSIEVGDRVMFGQSTIVVDGNHRFRDLDRPMLEQGYDFRPIRIEDDATITTKCSIIANVGCRAFIGANAVVVNDVPPYVVAGGIPAKALEYFGPPGQEPPELAPSS
jgi:acetyltransferase-like isoleucine patch superfamily enzyme